MTNKELAERIKAEIPCTAFLTPASKSGYICPLCGSGDKGHGTGALKYYEDTNTWYCHSCEQGGDVIKLIELSQGIGFDKAVKKLAGELTDKPQPITKKRTKEKPAYTYDYATYFSNCQKWLMSEAGKAAREYITGRGIGLDLAIDMGLGYDPKADPLRSGHPSPRLIIPTANGHYIARSIDPKEILPDFAKLNPRGVPVQFFNMYTLEDNDEHNIFLVEGAFDALSILQCGEEAIAINSTSNTGKFLDTLADLPHDNHFIICMDNDEAGDRARDALAAGLYEMGISYSIANICGDAKDPNEALQKDPSALAAAIRKATNETRPDNTSTYIDSFMRADVEHFKEERKTGFETFDKYTGGLFPGLYVLAAISSLGKTSFCLQMADQIAERGGDVLFFSMEMSRLELVSKSIARTAAHMNPKERITSIQIRRGEADVEEAKRKYKTAVGNRLSIIECNFDMSIDAITDHVRQYMKRTGTRPTIFIDYLQIIPTGGGDTKRGRREAIDNAVTELKRLSREIDAPVIVISSVNRMNYSTPIAFESLKESGGIEYSADVILGMQLQVISTGADFQADGKIVEKRKAIEEAKKANPRKIELKCLKNRYGVSSFSCFFDYAPDVDTFTDTGEPKTSTPSRRQAVKV